MLAQCRRKYIATGSSKGRSTAPTMAVHERGKLETARQCSGCMIGGKCLIDAVRVTNEGDGRWREIERIEGGLWTGEGSVLLCDVVPPFLVSL